MHLSDAFPAACMRGSRVRRDGVGGGRRMVSEAGDGVGGERWMLSEVVDGVGGERCMVSEPVVGYW